MARKRFLDGTIRIADLSEITGLRITQVATGTGIAFRVIALPGEEIIYWSFFRGKVNRFAMKKAEELKVLVDFESDLFGKSLRFNYSYAPRDYVLGGLFCIATAGFVQIDMDSLSLPVVFFVGLGLFQFLQAYRARAVLKNL
jgi:elongation factor Tu